MMTLRTPIRIMPPVTGIQYLRCLRENGRARSLDTPSSSTPGGPTRPRDRAPVSQADRHRARPPPAGATGASGVGEQLGGLRAARGPHDPAIEPLRVSL